MQPVDTEHKLNVYKTLRLCPGRLLNVLCTFNLRPVSTGNVQCMASNSENDNANIEIILHNGKLFAFYFKNIFQD